MSSALEARQRALQANLFGPQVAKCQREHYPAIAEVFAGVVEPDGSFTTPPFSVTLFADDGGVGFMLKAKGDTEAWFGIPTKSADILGAIEAAIATWQLKKKRDRSDEARY